MLLTQQACCSGCASLCNHLHKPGVSHTPMEFIVHATALRSVVCFVFSSHLRRLLPTSFFLGAGSALKAAHTHTYTATSQDGHPHHLVSLHSLLLCSSLVRNAQKRLICAAFSRRMTIIMRSHFGTLRHALQHGYRIAHYLPQIDKR